jgi:hypothetical protein
MALEGLPALAKLCVCLEGRDGGEEGIRTRVAPAFEAVAGTLTHLSIAVTRNVFNGEGMAYEVGVAVGKLRRLKDLALDLHLHEDGRTYHAFAQGVADSGGETPLPLLLRVAVEPEVTRNVGLLTSLLLPSVRVFASEGGVRRELLVLACALRQAGYKHTWAVYCRNEGEDIVEAIAQCRLGQLPTEELRDRLLAWSDWIGLRGKIRA